MFSCVQWIGFLPSDRAENWDWDWNWESGRVGDLRLLTVAKKFSEPLARAQRSSQALLKDA